MSNALKSPTQLVALEKKIYEYMKSKATGFECESSDELLSYQKTQKKYASREFFHSDLDELFRSFDNSRVIFVGDFHTFDQYSRNLERLLRQLFQKNEKWALGVEFVHQDFQYFINEYLDHTITEREFLEEIQYHDSWRFPWAQYGNLFTQCRKEKRKILALNSEGNLIERDRMAAKKVAQFLNDNPEDKVIIFFGELHIFPNRLPQFIREQMANDIPMTIIHQNLDEIYWKLIHLGEKRFGQVLKFNDEEFCLQTSPPWIKYESMIYWFENLYDDPDFDLHEVIIESSARAFNGDVHDHFVYICEEIGKILGVKLKNLTDFNLYDFNHLPILEEEISKLQKSTFQNFYMNKIKEGSSFKLPFKNLYYCSSYSINRLSYLAGLHIFHCMDDDDDAIIEHLLTGNQWQKLIFFTTEQTLAYFSSKIINPYRKCDLYMDYKDEEERNDDDCDPVIQAVVRILEAQSTEPLKGLLRNKSLYFLYSLGRKIGFHLGDILYHEFRDNHEVVNELFILMKKIMNKEDYISFLRRHIKIEDLQKYQKRFF